MKRTRDLAPVVFVVASLACHPSVDTSSKAASPVSVATTGVDGAVWLGPDAARARAAGAGPLSVLGADVASEGDRVGAFIDVAGGSCVLALTKSSPNVIDVDLFAYEDDGSAFATDESPDPQAALLLCPPTSRRFYVAARVVSGAGIVALGAMSVPKGAEVAVQKAVNARGRSGDEAARADAWPGLEARVRAHREALGGRWDELRRVALPVDPHAPTRISTSLEAGRCLDVFVTPSEEISSLEVVAEDDRGRILTSARPFGRDRGLVVCSRSSGSIGVAVRPRGSQGLVALSIARSSPGGDAELGEATRAVHLGADLDLEAERTSLDKRLRSIGYGPPKQIARGVARLGVRASFAVELPAGCSRLDVAVGRPFAELSAALWDERTELLADVRSGGTGVLYACGKGGPARLDLEPLEAAGPFAIELRKERSAPPVLVAHRIAAARLLGRLAAAGSPVDASAAATAQAVMLDASQLKSLPLTVPPKGCLEVIAALDGGAAGLDLRLVDERSGEGEVVRAHHVASSRICGGPAGAKAAAELRLDSGRAEALVLVRPADASR